MRRSARPGRSRQPRSARPVTAPPRRERKKGLREALAAEASAEVGRLAQKPPGRWWQAEYWISAIRNHVITLACLRQGYPAQDSQSYGEPQSSRGMVLGKRGELDEREAYGGEFGLEVHVTGGNVKG